MLTVLHEALAPDALRFGPYTCEVGLGQVQVLGAVAFPPRQGDAWLARLAAMPGVTCSLHVHPVDADAITTSAQQSITEYKSRLMLSQPPLARQRAEQGLADAEELLRAIDQEQERVAGCVLTLVVAGADAEELRRRVRAVQAAAGAAGMRLIVLGYRQEAGYTAAGPWEAPAQRDLAFAERHWPVRTVAAAYPWTTTGINHGRGVVWGRDAGGGIVLVDRSHRAPEDSGITNPNFNLLGASGGGKSFAAKAMLLREYGLGAQVLVLDPDREYRALAGAVGGVVVDCGRDGKGKINPLQVRGAGEESEGARAGVSGPLAQHMQIVKTFFSLYLPSLDDLERATLQDAILAAYAAKGVTWQTDPATVPVWPTIADVHAVLPQNSRLEVLLRDAATGVDSGLWAAQTSVPLASEFMVFDLSALSNAPKNVQRAQYFSVLGYAWDRVCDARAKQRPTLLLVDEAWVLADPQTPEALGFLRDLSKRIRKYVRPATDAEEAVWPLAAGGLWVVTQNIVDFLAPEVTRLGQPVLDNAGTKLLMRQAARDLEVLRDLLQLTEAECDLLAKAKVGEGLLIAGNWRAWVRIEASAAEAAMIRGQA